MPLTRDQAVHLAELACTIRPQWTVTAALRGLYPLAKHPADLPTLAWAVIRAAALVEQPADLPWNSPAWGLDRPPADLEDLNPRQLARQAAQRAAGTLEQPEQPEQPVIGADAPATPQPGPNFVHACPSCHRSIDHDVAAPDCHMKPIHPDPGSLPHHAGHPDHTAAHHHAYPWRRGLAPEERRRSAQQDAGKCLDTLWTDCPDGLAHLDGVCREPAGHHDAHRSDAGATWQRTHGLPPMDWCVECNQKPPRVVSTGGMTD